MADDDLAHEIEADARALGPSGEEGEKNAPDIMVRYSGDPAAIREQVRQVWERNIPQVPFDGRFAEDIVREQYQREEARGQLFAGFAVLAVVIGCLGLFGLAAFTAE